MPQIQLNSARPPLATRSCWNNVLDGGAAELVKPICDLGNNENAHVQQSNDAKNIKALENACRLMECSWSECDARLGSWELLRMHVEKVHCEVLSEASLGKASSSRPYRSRCASCHNRTFSNPALLLEHVVTIHLEPLKLRCPFACKQPASKLQSIVQHLSSVHGKTPSELPSAQIRLPPPRHAPLPNLATEAPLCLESDLRVQPCATFDPSKPKLFEHRSGTNDAWKDFADIEDSDAPDPFARLKLPESDHVLGEARLVPRGRVLFDGVQTPVRGTAGEQHPEGETVGFERWKRQFEEEEAESEGKLVKKRRK